MRPRSGATGRRGGAASAELVCVLHRALPASSLLVDKIVAQTPQTIQHLFESVNQSSPTGTAAPRCPNLGAGGFVMITPALYAQAYAELWSWMFVDGDWAYAHTPIVSYLQSGLGARSGNAKLAHGNFMSKLVRVTKHPEFAGAKTL